VGTAPGVLLSHGGATIAALPGVPRELEAIFEGSLAPLIREAAGGTVFREASFRIQGIPESGLAPLIDEAMRGSPGAYVKSHPRFSEGAPLIDIQVTSRGPNPEEVEKAVNRACDRLKELASKHGGAILS